MRFLGLENYALSIAEGRSDDGTYEILKSLREEIDRIGATYFLNTSDIDPTGGDKNRIFYLAELRNQALESLLQYPDRYSPDSTVLFFNDVSICMEDILELIY
jgi:alpha-1,3-mannosyltransferase